MSEHIPFLLHEATVTLYPEAADGSALTDQAVWCGAVEPQDMGLDHTYGTVRVGRTGAACKRTYCVDEAHQIELRKVWLLPRGTLMDFRPGKADRYVLQIVWHDRGRGLKYQRVYFGVTVSQLSEQSQGPLHYLVRQQYQAESMEQGPCA